MWAYSARSLDNPYTIMSFGIWSRYLLPVVDFYFLMPVQILFGFLYVLDLAIVLFIYLKTDVVGVLFIWILWITFLELVILNFMDDVLG